MAKGNGDKLVAAKQEFERDFKLTALVTQLNDLATKISEVEDQCRSKGRLKCGKSSKRCRMVNNRSRRQGAEEVGELDLIRCLTQDIFKLESVKLSEPREIIGESPTMSAIPTKTAIWTPTTIGDPVKFN
uniref:Integrase core domain containing protein n=2 Tax=Solanum tuberosum TaxID=4113 RepID=M1DKY0_SOLTU